MIVGFHDGTSLYTRIHRPVMRDLITRPDRLLVEAATVQGVQIILHTKQPDSDFMVLASKVNSHRPELVAA